MKILILGKSGQLGRCLFDQLKNAPHEIKFTSRKEIDIVNLEKTKEYIVAYNPTLVINTTSYNAVDKAEEDFKTANLVNNYAVNNMAKICEEIKSKLIHVSTDYVFDGTLNKPYQIDTKPNPKTKYGTSKLNGEIALRASRCNYLILRTSWLFSEYGNNFMKTILDIGSKNKAIKIVNDEIGCPTYTQDLAAAIIATFPKIDNDRCPWGLYHYSGNTPCSWFDFARKIFVHAEKFNHKVPELIEPIASKEYITKAVRPRYSVLDTKKFTEAFGVESSDWDRGIISALKAMKTT